MHHRLSLLVAIAAITLSLGGCDAAAPASSFGTAEAPMAAMCDTQQIGGECGGPGGGGTGGGGTPAQYRITYGLTSVDGFNSTTGDPETTFTAHTRHEVFENGDWRKTDGFENGVTCRNLSGSVVFDSEIEDRAGYTKITWAWPDAPPVQCDHQSRSPNGQEHFVTVTY